MNNFFETNLWVEKYRATNIDQLVLDDSVRNAAKHCLENKVIPNLLFYGPPGTGKTSLSRILIDNIMSESDDNVLYINGSANRGISLGREEVPNFLASPPFGKDKIKIVFIDEADNLTSDSQKALRHPIEFYTRVGRFIFTANKFSAFMDAIVSRFQIHELKPLTESQILSFCLQVLNVENVEHSEAEVSRAVKLFMPDVRKILNTLQSYTYQLKLRLPSTNDLIPIETTIAALANDIFKAYQLKDSRCQICLNKLQEILMRKDINYSVVFENLFFEKATLPICKVLANKYCNNLNMVASQPMHFMAFTYETLEALKEIK